MKKIRQLVNAPVWFLICALTALGLSSICAAYGQSIDFGGPKYLAAQNTIGPAGDEIKQLQQQLGAQDDDPGPQNGRIDNLTRQALDSYCREQLPQIKKDGPDKDLSQQQAQSEMLDSYLITPDDAKTLAGNPETKSVAKALTPLVGAEFATAALFDNAVDQMLKTDEEKAAYNDAVKNELQKVARKTHSLEGAAPIAWNSTRCGCVPDLTGETYGLYPYWMAEQKDEKGNAPAIVFDALTRIGYYALFMDAEGRIQKDDLWETAKKHTAPFIDTAHRYRTRVDIVICCPVWQTWRQMATGYRSPTMVDQISSLVFVTPGFDGVTLYFNTYPKKETTEPDAMALKLFLDLLSKRLSPKPTGPHLNLMFPAITKDNKERVSQFFTTLFPGTPDHDDASDPVNLILTFLNYPTSTEKKEMRYIIERMFKGKQRQKMLRKIVPIINLSKKPEPQQFRDDLIYFEDNFGGVGFWPAPAAGKENITDQISEEIVSQFQPDEHITSLQKTLKDRSRTLCRYVCPNRAVIEYVFFTILFILGAWALGACWVCELRILFRSGFLYLMAVVAIEVLVLASLLACDPDWTKYATLVFIALAVLLTIFLVFRQISKMKEEKYP